MLDQSINQSIDQLEDNFLVVEVLVVLLLLLLIFSSLFRTPGPVEAGKYVLNVYRWCMHCMLLRAVCANNRDHLYTKIKRMFKKNFRN